jgi:NAD-dependent dihydropyrimidine dehydrogenase PreA subunit
MVKISEEFPGIEWIHSEEVFITVVQEKCTGCAKCLNVCLAGCYEMKNLKARIKSLTKCMECSACWYICPENAVNFSFPPGGTGFKTKFG